MKKSNRPKMGKAHISRSKETYMSPRIEVLSIAMEYSIASGSGVVDSGSVNKEWNQESVQNKELNW